MKNGPKKIAVIYNQLSENDDDDVYLSDKDTLTTASEVCEALNKSGYNADILEVSPNKIKNLVNLKDKYDLVFNLCEWLGKNIHLDCGVIKTLEKNNIPYTGASAKNYAETADKIAFKIKMTELELPTPKWQVIKNRNEKLEIGDLRFPLIVKPVYEHGSIGVSQDSIVTDEQSLRKQVSKMLEKYNQPVLIEEFITGRELNISMIGDTILPITEMKFGKGFENKWNILTFSCKFLDRSWEFIETNAMYPTEIEGIDLKNLQRLAKIVYKKMGCQDYVRLDIRLTREGEAFVIDLNSNPSLENARIATMVAAQAYGWNYEQLIDQIVGTAWKRCVNENTREIRHSLGL